jgi:hypothetical protein
MGVTCVKHSILGALLLSAVIGGCTCREPAKIQSTRPVFGLLLGREGAPPMEGSALANDAKVDYGLVRSGRVERKRLSLTNSGNAPLHLDGPTLEKGAEFKLKDVLKPCTDRQNDPAEIPVGECSTVAIEYAPLTLGDHADVLTVKSDDPERPEVKLLLSARAGAGILKVCVASVVGADKDAPIDQCSSADKKELSVNFGSVTMGGEAAKRRLQVTNAGEIPLEITSIEPDLADPIDFAVEPWGYAETLGKFESVDMSLLFKPTDIGERSATVTVSGDDSNGAPVQIRILARGDAPKLCVKPTSIEYGNVDLGTSASQTITLTNCGTRAVEVTDLALDWDPSFTIAQAASTAPLAPGQSTSVNIEFKPTGLGPKSGRMRVTSTDPISPVSFARLNGNGMALPECKFEASAAAVDFGAVVQGAKAARFLTFHNAGGRPCTIKRLAIESAGSLHRFSVEKTPGLPATLPANGLLDVTAVYEPQNVNGPHTSTLQIEVDDPALGGKPMAIALKGAPTPRPECRLDILPTLVGMVSGRQMQFGATGLGDKKKLLMTVKNVGGLECNLAVPAFGRSTDVAVFSFGKTSPALPGKLAPGARGEVEVVFQPNREASWFGATHFFTLNTDDNLATECGPGTPAGCKKVLLQGSGARMAIDVVPGSLDFGVVAVGCNSPDRTVTVYNLGAAAITLNKIYTDPTTAPFTVIQKPPLPFSLAAGASVTLSVRYRPSAATVETALLTIEHSFSNGVNTVQVKGSGTSDKHQVDVFQQNASPKTDVLWVVDNSCSMADKQVHLSGNAQTFITQANAKNADYQVAVISTDWSKTNTTWPSKGDYTASYPGARIFTGEFYPTPQPSFTFSSPQVIRRTDPNPAQLLAKNIKVGQCCSDMAEAGLEAAKVALSNPLISDPSKPNSTFIRPDAKLAIIVLSDEEEQGPVQNVQYYVDYFQQLKGAKNTTLFAWHSIVGDAPNGCLGNNLWGARGLRYIDASKRSGGIFRSICSTDWGRISNDIGLDAFAAKTQFLLSRSPDLATLDVKVNGAPKTKGVDYDYDAASNSVVFRTAAIPGPGTKINVEYDTLCL